MAEEPQDPPIEQIIEHRLPDPLPPHEREVYEGKIKELRDEIEQLEIKLEKALKPAPTPKRKSAIERFSPL